MSDTGQTIALVTGANKGLGWEIARQLASAGTGVFLGARDTTRGEQAAKNLREEGLDVEFMLLDVGDPAIINQAADRIAAKFGRLDVLVNNAGVFDPIDGDAGQVPMDSVRRTFDTNFFGALSVVQAMLPLLRQSPAGRIVNVSSSTGSLGRNGDPASPYYGARYIGYNASKAALNMLTVQLSEDLRGSGILVNSACPGFVKTDLNGHSGTLSAYEAAKVPVALALLSSDGVSGQFVDAKGQVPW